MFHGDVLYQLAKNRLFYLLKVDDLYLTTNAYISCKFLSVICLLFVLHITKSHENKRRDTLNDTSIVISPFTSSSLNSLNLCIWNYILTFWSICLNLTLNQNFQYGLKLLKTTNKTRSFLLKAQIASSSNYTHIFQNWFSAVGQRTYMNCQSIR